MHLTYLHEISRFTSDGIFTISNHRFHRVLFFDYISPNLTTRSCSIIAYPERRTFVDRDADNI